MDSTQAAHYMKNNLTVTDSTQAVHYMKNNQTMISPPMNQIQRASNLKGPNIPKIKYSPPP
jgi:hypothetical protein